MEIETQNQNKNRDSWTSKERGTLAHQELEVGKLNQITSFLGSFLNRFVDRFGIILAYAL